VNCAICEIRKEKRFCPAVHGRICSQCCGEQREITLDCPSDCPYLLQARQHEKRRSLDEVDPSALFLPVELGDHFVYQHEQLIAGLSYALVRSARRDRSIADRDLIAGLTSLARSYERLVNSGLHYEEPIQPISQQAVITQLQAMVNEYRETEQKHRGYTTLKDSELLKALVFLVRMAHAHTSGRPKSRAFVDFLFAQFPERESALFSPDQGGSRIVTP
jgi:hypothetical protein